MPDIAKPETWDVERLGRLIAETAGQDKEPMIRVVGTMDGEGWDVVLRLEGGYASNYSAEEVADGLAYEISRCRR